VKHILRYLAGTCDWGLWFGRKERQGDTLTGYRDSDYAGDVDVRYSTTGVIFFLGGNPITWQSMKQKVVAQLSCEAEYIATPNATCQGLCLARVLAEVKGTEPRAPLLKVDNQSAIALIKNHVISGQSHHIKVKYHLVRESAARGQIKVEVVGIGGQLGDILTKSLSKVKFQELRDIIGLINTSTQYCKA
jgi:hypothetical protein